ncbi:hypothetical protein ACFVXC_19985 [Streptomyces sp. NPDC058257]|uniref:hypothetical protein n=1 Tax=Streptomyces sp. NPDC058257 TaxID=3346409 RepID=UPI0036E50A97
MEGDGESSIPAEAVYVQVLDDEIELPSDMANCSPAFSTSTSATGAPASTPG